ncbi:MAG: rod shape-determining protein MreD [Acidobacteria bacterium]|nr:rod shape-determining protein MreD [Acidobacteriota bacterium]
MTALRVLVTVAAALVLQTTLARFLVRGAGGVDLVLVAVVYLGLTSGPTAGILSGTMAGLAQDSLGSGIVGVGGLAKTVVGYLAGRIGTTFIVSQTIPRFLVFFGATLVQVGLTTGLYYLLDPRPPVVTRYAVLGESLANALLGVVFFQIVDALPGMIDRRRGMSRGRVR